jgi:hypothetical protein
VARKSWAKLPLNFDTIAMETRIVRDIEEWTERTRIEGCWRQVSAPSGAGKSHALLFLKQTRYREVKDPTGLTISPVIDLITPHEARRRAGGKLLRERLAIRLGAVVSRRRQTEAAWLAAEMESSGVECLVLDDSHKLDIEEDIPALKELSDLYAQRSGGRRFGVLFLAASVRGENILRAVFEDRDPEEYAQYLGRMAPEQRYIRLRGLSVDDVRDALLGYEDHFLKEGVFPGLRLVRFTEDIYRFLKLRALAPAGRRQVIMRSLRWFVEGIVRRLVARGQDDIDDAGDLVEEVGQSLLDTEPTDDEEWEDIEESPSETADEPSEDDEARPGVATSS